MKKHPYVTGLLLTLTTGLGLVTSNAVAGSPPASPEITAALQSYLDSYKLAGFIGIVADKQGKIQCENLIGYADVEAKKPISTDNVFWIASMTKMFAGASIMMLVDEGKVSLDDPVTKFIPQLDKWMVVEEKDPAHVLLKPLVRPVTVRHVLSHTSGLTGSSELQQVTGADSTPLKARALSSVTGPLQWQPGDKYQYGNQGMNIAARIVEIVSGLPYEEFLHKRFFDPLGMNETTFWPSEAQVARLAGAYGPNKEKNGYAGGGVSFLTKPFSDRVLRFPEAGGGLFSTTHDILRYGLMLATTVNWTASATFCTRRWRNCGRNKPERRRSITAWAIICATACLGTPAPRAPICRSTRPTEWWRFSWSNVPGVTSGPPATCSSRRPRKYLKMMPRENANV